jgi:hypothetical protein
MGDGIKTPSSVAVVVNRHPLGHNATRALAMEMTVFDYEHLTVVIMASVNLI